MTQKIKNKAISPIIPITVAQTFRFIKPQTARIANKIATIIKIAITIPSCAFSFISTLHLPSPMNKTSLNFLINTLKKDCGTILSLDTAFSYILTRFKDFLVFSKKFMVDVLLNLGFDTQCLFFGDIRLPFTNKGKKECNGQRRQRRLCEINARGKYIIVQEKKGETNYWRNKGKKEAPGITEWGDFCPPFKNLLSRFYQGYFSISYLFPKNLFSQNTHTFPNPISLSFPSLNAGYVLKPLSSSVFLLSVTGVIFISCKISLFGISLITIDSLALILTTFHSISNLDDILIICIFLLVCLLTIPNIIYILRRELKIVL